MDDETKIKTYKNGTIIGGALTVGLIALTLHTQHNLRASQETTNEWKANFIENDSMRVAEYNNLLEKHNDALYDITLKDSINDELNNKTDRLTNTNWNLKQEINNLENKYETTTDSLNNLLDEQKQNNKKLAGLVINNETVIEFMKDDITHKNKLIETYNNRLQESKTMHERVQEHLNAYIINRRPIREKHLNKVYMPNDTTFTPLGRCEVRDVRQLNREYKQAN